jgi:hypothetical protein
MGSAGKAVGTILTQGLVAAKGGVSDLQSNLQSNFSGIVTRVLATSYPRERKGEGGGPALFRYRGPIYCPQRAKS